MVKPKNTIEVGALAVREVADFLFARSQENLIIEKAIDTSNLFLSGEIEPQKDGSTIVRYTAPYAKDINDGTDPHFVDAKDLIGWIRRKINPGTEQKVRQIAFLIARKIAERGTKSQPFMDRALAQTRAHFK